MPHIGSPTPWSAEPAVVVSSEPMSEAAEKADERVAKREDQVEEEAVEEEEAMTAPLTEGSMEAAAALAAAVVQWVPHQHPCQLSRESPKLLASLARRGSRA